MKTLTENLDLLFSARAFKESVCSRICDNYKKAHVLLPIYVLVNKNKKIKRNCLRPAILLTEAASFAASQFGNVETLTS